MLKKLTVVSLFLLALFAVTGNTSSQTMYFCEGVTDDGYPITESSTFNIGSGGGYVYALVRLPYEIACRSVRFEVYRNGAYDNTIYVDTEKNWVWFWKKITFYDSGNFTVYAYDCFDYQLCSGSVRINFR
ncbi:MAG: hypothetical protein IAE90_13085 [Ignavibacteria bacterium]|nr:hypothetical protein [Ignavibacteria bacterium]